MTKLFNAFCKSKSGATAIEYSLIAAGISLAIITVVGAVGTKISDKLQLVVTALT